MVQDVAKQVVIKRHDSIAIQPANGANLLRKSGILLEDQSQGHSHSADKVGNGTILKWNFLAHQEAFPGVCHYHFAHGLRGVGETGIASNEEHFELGG